MLTEEQVEKFKQDGAWGRVRLGNLLPPLYRTSVTITTTLLLHCRRVPGAGGLRHP